jgi:hypothetical protein
VIVGTVTKQRSFMLGPTTTHLLILSTLPFSVLLPLQFLPRKLPISPDQHPIGRRHGPPVDQHPSAMALPSAQPTPHLAEAGEPTSHRQAIDLGKGVRGAPALEKNVVAAELRGMAVATIDRRRRSFEEGGAMRI